MMCTADCVHEFQFVSIPLPNGLVEMNMDIVHSLESILAVFSRSQCALFDVEGYRARLQANAIRLQATRAGKLIYLWRLALNQYVVTNGK